MTTKHERIARAITDSGYTQQEIADALGMSRGAVGHWLTGRAEPTAAKLIALANFLRISPDYLRTGIGSPSPQINLFGPLPQSYGLTAPGPRTLAHNLPDCDLIYIDSPLILF